MQLCLETVLSTESHMPETSSAETEGSDRKWCTQFTGWEAVQMSLGFQKKKKFCYYQRTLKHHLEIMFCFSLTVVARRGKEGSPEALKKKSQILTSTYFFLELYWGPFPLKLEDHDASQKKVPLHGDILRLLGLTTDGFPEVTRHIH